MQVIYVKRRTVINILSVLAVVAVSILYTKGPGKETIGAFLNNEKYIPVYSVDVPDKRIALTFDVTWGENYTQEITDMLKRYNIKATFFMTGTWINRYPDIVEEVFKYGHDIGNHTTTHVKMSQLTKDSILNEIKQTEEDILRITGKKPVLFRVPYGEYNDRIIMAAREMDYNTIQWDVDSFDWMGILHKDIYDKVTQKVSGGSIVLFHCNVENTVKALPDIIEELRRQGYKFTTVSELLLKENYYIDNTGRQKSLK